jgi:hypothetical protein
MGYWLILILLDGIEARTGFQRVQVVMAHDSSFLIPHFFPLSPLPFRGGVGGEAVLLSMP